MSTVFSKNALTRYWPDFVCRVKKRLKAGAEAYGDISFDRSPTELVDEIRQELADIAGWAWILDTRMFHLMEKIKALESQIEHSTQESQSKHPT